MLILLILILVVAVSVFFFLRQPQFGRASTGARLHAIRHSPNFREGQFQNQHHTPSLTEGASYTGVMKQFFFGPKKRNRPGVPLPSKKTSLFELDDHENVLVWFGHSSYFMQLDGKKILVDPVFSGNASPFSFTTKSFRGTDVYTVDDMPDIDLLFLSHDHYDHLDYRTIRPLRKKVKKIITGLGTGAHLEAWGYAPSILVEKDWNEEILLGDGFRVNTVPARHFSGRKFKRNGSLWTSFVLTTPSKKIFIGGDSGYDTHFREIGKQYGPFDLAILENGQYNKNWKYIHMMPEEVVQAAQDLDAHYLLPVHWAKFSLSLHEWDEPIKRVVAEAEKNEVRVLHPMIGEKVELDKENHFTEWWKNIDGG